MKRLIQIGAYAAALAAIGGAAAGAWSVGGYLGVRPILKSEFEMVMQQVQQNTEAVLRIQFDNLMARRKYGELTFDEQQTLCQLAAALKYVNVPGC